MTATDPLVIEYAEIQAMTDIGAQAKRRGAFNAAHIHVIEEIQRTWRDNYTKRNNNGHGKLSPISKTAEAQTRVAQAQDHYDESGTSPPVEEVAYAVGLDQFVAMRSDAPPALMGEPEEVIIPAKGLIIPFGVPGHGKTTIVIDLVFHLATGREWLGFNVPRPVRILIIENEGPQELFREKLERKLTRWSHAEDREWLSQNVMVKTVDWAQFALDREGEAARLNLFIVEHDIDLVVGDPLNTLGVRGVGSPDDTRTFVAYAVEAGLNRDAAFLLIHHPKKSRDNVNDVLDEMSGDWGGKIDTALKIESDGHGHSTLTFAKIRHRHVLLREPMQLTFDIEDESYATAATEGSDGTTIEATADDRMIWMEIKSLMLRDRSVWYSLNDLKRSKTPADGGSPGIGRNREKIAAALNAHRPMLEVVKGRAIGKKKQAAETDHYRLTDTVFGVASEDTEEAA